MILPVGHIFVSIFGPDCCILFHWMISFSQKIVYILSDTNVQYISLFCLLRFCTFLLRWSHTKIVICVLIDRLSYCLGTLEIDAGLIVGWDLSRTLLKIPLLRTRLPNLFIILIRLMPVPKEALVLVFQGHLLMSQLKMSLFIL